jgi:hypothetical protein
MSAGKLRGATSFDLQQREVRQMRAHATASSAMDMSAGHRHG